MVDVWIPDVLMELVFISSDWAEDKAVKMVRNKTTAHSCYNCN